MKPTSLSPTLFSSSLALAALLALTGCRFNPQAAQRLAERGSTGTRPGATAAALMEPTAADKTAANSITPPTATAAAAAPAPDTLPPTATVAAMIAATSVATPAATTAAAQPQAPTATPTSVVVNGVVTSSAALTSSTFIPAVNTGEKAAPASAQSVAPGPAVDTEGAVVADPAVSSDINRPKVVAKRPKVTVRRPRVVAARRAPARATRSVCTISTRATVNLRALPTTRSRRMAVLRPRTRFVAVARSANSRWVYGVSPRGRGWVSAATVRCVPAPRVLTVRR